MARRGRVRIVEGTAAGILILLVGCIPGWAQTPKPDAAAGAAGECTTCHAQIADAPPTGSKHAAVDGGCDTGEPDPLHAKKAISCVTCHDAHASAGSPQLLVTATKSCSQLRLRCHP